MAISKLQEEIIKNANKNAKEPGIYENPLNKDMVAVKDAYGGFQGMTRDDAEAWQNGGADRLRQKALDIAAENEAWREADLKATQGHDPFTDSPKKTPTNPLAQAIAGTPQTTATTPQTTADNSLVSALKAKIQQAIVNRKAQTQPLRDNSEVQKANELRMALEQAANMGDRGGIGRQTALETQTAGENRLNQINLAEQSDVANIEANGAVDTAQLEAELQRQATENQRYNQQQSYQQQQTAYQQQQNALQLALQQQQQALDNQYRQQQFDYNKQQDTAQQPYQKQQQELALQQQQAAALQQRAKVLAQANYNNIAGLINSLAPNDPLRPYLEAERQAKIQREGLDQYGNKLPTAPQQMSYTEAINAWKTYGIATEAIAKILGVPVGAKTSDYIEMQYDTNKPYYAPKTSSNSSSSGTPWYLK
jgi:hypothetical protein